MTPEEALHAVQQALADRGLPGGVGLRQETRTFIVCLAPADRKAAPAVAELLESMGCQVAVNGFVYGRLAGRLRVPPVHVSSADSCRAAESAAVTAAKRCNGPCGEVKPVSEFSSNGGGKLMPACRPCDAARQRTQRLARMASR